MGILKRYEKFVAESATVRNEAYAGLGLSGESGEVFDEVQLLRQACRVNEAHKKVVRNGNDTDNLKSELGDVLWYVTRIANQYDLRLKDLFEYNIEKISDRQQNGKKTG